MPTVKAKKRKAASRAYRTRGDRGLLSGRRSRRDEDKSQAPPPSPSPVKAEVAKAPKDDSPATRIRPGTATIKGAPDSAAVARTLRKWARAFRRVYDRALKVQGPGFGGRVVFELEVGPGGRVSSAKVVGNSTGSDDFAHQLLAVAKRFRFGTSGDGGPVTIRCPFVFKPGQR